MDENYKRSIRKAHHRGLGKQRTREEQKQLRQRSRERKSGGDADERPRRRHWTGGDLDDDEPAGFERLVSARDLPPLRQQRRGSSATLPPTTAPPPPPGERALVASVARARARVLLDGEELELALRPELARAQQGALAVGDEVVVERLDADARRVAAVLPRRSVLARPDPGDPRRELVVAANVDLAVIVLTPEGGAPKLGLVDRVLVALDRGGVGALVCVNKLDLLVGREGRARVERALAPYRELGAPALLVSATTGEGVDDLRRAIGTTTCVFVGQSGVGKSSLLNAIDPSGARATRETRERDGKGRHTTTASSLTVLANGARVIDTPGVRSFGLGAIGPDELAAAFPELAREASGCRYADCTHLHEPECAVRAAVEAGRVARARYDSYARILGSD